MTTTKHTGKCPCGCGRDVPNNCYWATERCGRVYRDQMEREGNKSPLCYTGRSKAQYRPSQAAMQAAGGD